MTARQSTKQLNLRSLASLVRNGEGTTLEFKKTTGELKAGMQTL